MGSWTSQRIQAKSMLAHQSSVNILKTLQEKRESQHLGFSATEMALITLMVAPTRCLTRDQTNRWNHPDAPSYLRGAISVNGEPRDQKRSYLKGFADRTIHQLIDAGRCEAVRYNGNGAPTEVRILPL